MVFPPKHNWLMFVIWFFFFSLTVYKLCVKIKVNDFFCFRLLLLVSLNKCFLKHKTLKLIKRSNLNGLVLAFYQRIVSCCFFLLSSLFY